MLFINSKKYVIYPSEELFVPKYPKGEIIKGILRLTLIRIENIRKYFLNRKIHLCAKSGFELTFFGLKFVVPTPLG